MEKEHECAVININIPNIKTTDQLPSQKPLQQQQQQQKKKSSGVRFLRVALFKMRGRSAKPSVVHEDHQDTTHHDDEESKRSIWRKFVGSMRPMHLQSNESPRSILSLPSTPECNKSDCGSYVSDFVAEEEPYSPSPPSSRYASAVGLNELLQNDDEENNQRQEVIVEDECEEHVIVDGSGSGSGSDGDEMIDAKAEDFIAHFYRQMKLQRLDSVNRRYDERNRRSLGC